MQKFLMKLTRKINLFTEYQFQKAEMLKFLVASNSEGKFDIKYKIVFLEGMTKKEQIDIYNKIIVYLNSRDYKIEINKLEDTFIIINISWVHWYV